jgi:hypothetical protein
MRTVSSFTGVTNAGTLASRNVLAERFHPPLPTVGRNVELLVAPGIMITSEMITSEGRAAGGTGHARRSDAHR